jgi:NDP-sugar pyrophosphorylase family protein
MEKVKDFQILIPMTGYGSRFAEQGYSKLKPFIEVHGRPIIEWVVKMFPGDESNITFICREEHLNELTYFRKDIERIAPNASIFSIHDWEKRGPVMDILKAKDIIEPDRPIIISYCDFYMHWDYIQFKKEVISRNCDGSMPCYSGFHPHLIPEKNLYGSCKVDEQDNLIEIREKYSWNKDKSLDINSPGVFFFKNSTILTKYCQQLVDENININNEYYMSLPFNFLVQDDLKVWCPSNVHSFCQWGTPEDLEDYLYWINKIDQFWVTHK